MKVLKYNLYMIRSIDHTLVQYYDKTYKDFTNVNFYLFIRNPSFEVERVLIILQLFNKVKLDFSLLLLLFKVVACKMSLET